MAIILPEKVRKYFGEIWFLWLIVLLLNIITFLFIFFKIHPGNQVLALHYNVLIGVDWRGKGISLYLIPVAGFLVSGVNYILYKALKDDQIFLSELAIFASFCIQLILLASVIFLARVN